MVRVRRAVLALAVLALIWSGLPFVAGSIAPSTIAAGQPPGFANGTTTRLSVSSSGAQSTGSVGSRVAISADGRWVAFASSARDLVPEPTSGFDVYLRDRQAGTTTLVSHGPPGTAPNGASSSPSISGDGRFVAFASLASNLVPQDTNGAADVFVFDARTGAITRVSTSSAGAQAAGWSSSPSISSDGRFVAFDSTAANLVARDTNG